MTEDDILEQVRLSKRQKLDEDQGESQESQNDDKGDEEDENQNVCTIDAKKAVSILYLFATINGCDDEIKKKNLMLLAIL